jgi:hypothetical protein
MAFRILPSAWEGISVNPTGFNFPFAAPSQDIFGLFADAFLTHTVRDAVAPYRVVWAYGFHQYLYEDPGDAPTIVIGDYSPSHDADLVILDAEDAVIFDSTQATYYQAKDFGDKFRIHEWRTDTAICRVVQHTAYPSVDEIIEYTATIEPEDGELDPQVVEIQPEQVLSITVADTIFTGNVQLLNGYNGTISSTLGRRNGQTTKQLTFAAGLDIGYGRYPDCIVQLPAFYRINGVQPDELGNILLTGRGCYWVRRPQEAPYARAHMIPNTIQIGNDCVPCCDCEDYGNVYKAMIRLHSQFSDIGIRAEATRDLLEQNFTRWREQASCRARRVIGVYALPHNGNKVEIAASLCNTTGECMLDVSLEIEITLNSPASMLCETTILTTDPCATMISTPNGKQYYTLTVVGDKLKATWAEVEPNAAAVIRFRAEIPAECLDETSSITVCVTATVGGVPYPDAVADQEKCTTVTFPEGC